MKILKCNNCDKYTLKHICQNCNSKTASVIPAKFSLEDKYGFYRRLSKEKN